MSCTADLILQAPNNSCPDQTQSPSFQFSVTISPLEHSVSFNDSALQTTHLQPVGRLNSNSAKRKAYLEQLPREGHVYNLTTETHPKALTALLRKLYKTESALILSYFISTCHIGQALLFPLSQTRALLVKSESFTKELADSSIIPFVSVTDDLENSTKSRHFDILAARFYQYLSRPGIKLEIVFDLLLDIKKILKLMRKSLLEFVTQANPAEIKENLFCQLGRIILLIELNSLKFADEIKSRTTRTLMLTNDLPKNSGFKLIKFMDEQIHPRYNYTSESCLRKMYETSVNFFYPGDDSDSGSSDSDGDEIENNSMFDFDIYDQNSIKPGELAKSEWVDEEDDIYSESRSKSHFELSVGSASQYYNPKSQFESEKVSRGGIISSQNFTVKLNKNNKLKKEVKALKTPRKEPKTPKKVKTKPISMTDTPFKKQSAGIRSHRYRKIRRKARHDLVKKSKRIPEENEVIEEESAEITRVSKESIPETPLNKKFYRGEPAMSNTISRRLSDAFNKFTIETESNEFTGVLMDQITLSIVDVQKNTKKINLKQVEIIHSKTGLKQFERLTPQVLTLDKITACLKQRHSNNQEQNMSSPFKIMSSPFKSGRSMTSPFKKAGKTPLRRFNSACFDKPSNSPLKSLSRIASMSEISNASTPTKRKKNTSTSTHSVESGMKEECFLPSSQLFQGDGASESQKVNGGKKKRKIERLDTFSTFGSRSSLPEAIFSIDDLKSSEDEDDMFEEKMRDTDEIKINGTPNATTLNHNDRTQTTPNGTHLTEHGSISPAAIHDLTTKQILTPRVLDRRNKLNTQDSNKSDGSRKLSFSDVDAPVFGGIGGLNGIAASDDENDENSDNDVLTRMNSNNFMKRVGSREMKKQDSLAAIFYSDESNQPSY